MPIILTNFTIGTYFGVFLCFFLSICISVFVSVCLFLSLFMIACLFWHVSLFFFHTHSDLDCFLLAPVQVLMQRNLLQVDQGCFEFCFESEKDGSLTLEPQVFIGQKPDGSGLTNISWKTETKVFLRPKTLFFSVFFLLISLSLSLSSMFFRLSSVLLSHSDMLCLSVSIYLWQSLSLSLFLPLFYFLKAVNNP